MTREELIAFINSQDTFDLIIRHPDYIQNFSSDSNIIYAQTLGGIYDLCYTNIDYLPYVQKVLGTNFVSSVSILLGIQDTLYLDSAGITPIQYQPYLNLRGRGVIIGFIDTGIDYTLDIFRYENGESRIISIYDQSAQCCDPPPGFFIGREYTKEDIDLALLSPDPYSIVPERDTSGHGTFLASIAAGNSRKNDFSGAAPECGIIAVKLREARRFYRELFAVPDSAENVFESNAVIAGAEYIIEKARSLGMPAVICLGMGSNSGSHDGCGIFEEYLNSISKLRGVCVCVSAGNECRAHHHAAGSIPAAGMTSDISIKVENGGNIYANIRNGASDKLSASVRSPTGELIGRVSSSPDLMITRKMVLEPSEISIGYYFPTECSSGQLTAVRITDATAGIWTITLYGDIILGGTYDAWLPITGLCGKGIEFLSSTPYSTVTVPATAQGIICCGAYDHLNGSLYLESSWGPSRTLSMLPDLTAPGVNISGIYPTGAGTMSGTSASAAITAGAAALMMQWGAVLGNDPSMSTHQIKAYLIRGCRRSDPISYPNTQWGYGTLDLAQSFDRLREI